MAILPDAPNAVKDALRFRLEFRLQAAGLSQAAARLKAELQTISEESFMPRGDARKE